ncbi:cob(I)yrinic acid a,c-diamide adenosyltransferase [Calditrichota bacterium]
MKIYTKKGDKGKTSLLRGGRVPKYHPRVEAYGDIDELNSYIGYIRSISTNEDLQAALKDLQPSLHVLSADVAAEIIDIDKSDKVPRIKSDDSIKLERKIDIMDNELPELMHFILPGGSPVGAMIHIARTVCRRAERLLVQVSDDYGGTNPQALIYLNRLSDYLFTLARWENFKSGIQETEWKV